jgi:hypothetical protein
VEVIGLAAGVIAAIAGIVRATPSIARWWERRRTAASAVDRIEARLAMKERVELNLPTRDEWRTRGEAIIRDVRRHDRYPDISDKQRRISPWFKVEVKGTYHRGLEVFLSISAVVLDREKKTWRYAKREEELDLKGFVVGRIPFDWIASIDWEGDEYYPMPHFYCRFLNRWKEPYESLELYYNEEPGGFHYHLEGYSMERVRRWRQPLERLREGVLSRSERT